MKKKTLTISLVILIMLILIVGSIIIIFSDSLETTENKIQENEQTDNLDSVAPSKMEEGEKEISKKKQQELFDFIPKVYTEGIAPFTSSFMLDAVMKKIINNEEQDFSVKNVDNYVIRMFGENAKINKEDVCKPNVASSLFYYSKEAGTYAVIPVGYEGKFEYQILKNATETDDAYYVYTYTLIGGYSYDESSITQDEFGDIDYENANVQVIIGDKDGNDLVHIFDKYSLIYDETVWLDEYSNVMPVFRYTLKKDDGGYYLTEVEQINY